MQHSAKLFPELSVRVKLSASEAELLSNVENAMATAIDTRTPPESPGLGWLGEFYTPPKSHEYLDTDKATGRLLAPGRIVARGLGKMRDVKLDPYYQRHAAKEMLKVRALLERSIRMIPQQTETVRLMELARKLPESYARDIVGWSKHQRDMQNLFFGKLTNVMLASALLGGAYGGYKSLGKWRELRKLDKEMRRGVEKTAGGEERGFWGRALRRLMEAPQALGDFIGQMPKVDQDNELLALRSALKDAINPYPDRPVTVGDTLNPFYWAARLRFAPPSTLATALPWGASIPLMAAGAVVPFAAGNNAADDVTDAVRRGWVERRKRQAKEEYTQALTEGLKKTAGVAALDELADAYVKQANDPVRFVTGAGLLGILLASAAAAHVGRSAALKQDPGAERIKLLRYVMRQRELQESKSRTRMVPVERISDVEGLSKYDFPVVLGEGAVKPKRKPRAAARTEALDLSKLGKVIKLSTDAKDGWDTAKRVFSGIGPAGGGAGGALAQGARSWLDKNVGGIRDAVTSTREALPRVRSLAAGGDGKLTLQGYTNAMRGFNTAYDNVGGAAGVKRLQGMAEWYGKLRAGDWGGLWAMLRPMLGNILPWILKLPQAIGSAVTGSAK